MEGGPIHQSIKMPWWVEIADTPRTSFKGPKMFFLKATLSMREWNQPILGNPSPNQGRMPEKRTILYHLSKPRFQIRTTISSQISIGSHECQATNSCKTIRKEQTRFHQSWLLRLWRTTFSPCSSLMRRKRSKISITSFNLSLELLGKKSRECWMQLPVGKTL